MTSTRAGLNAKTFISYARQDFEFVMILANDLRTAGANIWLDRFDIPVGKNWPQAVEDALTSCDQFLVVLSPASICSSNVMAELNFAIDEGKRVFPVLCQECKQPFRIRAVQYADFTIHYQNGFSNLLKALGIEQERSTLSSTAALQRNDRSTLEYDHVGTGEIFIEQTASLTPAIEAFAQRDPPREPLDEISPEPTAGRSRDNEPTTSEAYEPHVARPQGRRSLLSFGLFSVGLLLILSLVGIGWYKFQIARAAAREQVRGLMTDVDRVISSSRRGDTLTDSEWARAQSVAVSALKIAPNNMHLTSNLRIIEGQLNFTRASAHHDSKMMEQARQNFEDAAQLDPKSPDPWLALTRLYVYGLHNINAAESALERAERSGLEIGRLETSYLADGYRDRGERTLKYAQDAISQSEVDRYTDLARNDLEMARSSIRRSSLGVTPPGISVPQTKVWINSLKCISCLRTDDAKPDNLPQEMQFGFSARIA